ncbi:hypothetical protein [Williamsia muralis]
MGRHLIAELPIIFLIPTRSVSDMISAVNSLPGSGHPGCASVT